MTTAIIVHGGAGPARSDDDAEAARQGCLLAARAGYAVLARGGSALDAVEEAVRTLEDDPQFNAGIGSCLTADGDVEMDASLMEGATLRAGAVALVRGVRNPIRLARCVMERTPHLFLAGEGAMRLAREQGLPILSPAELITPRALARWREAKAKGAASPSGGTVGAVALDAHGHLAAATSTGGMNGKWSGRIGDTPVIGAGTYADDAGGAASATGHGEAILRVGLTRMVVAQLCAGAEAQSAAEVGLGALARIGGEGGVIVIDRSGRVGCAFNTARMSHAFIDATGAEGSGFLP
ncbi:MAG: isoaspartyl peptidase/L-asparaginase [Myxococcaceae bacterium]|nr:isoaspartyl peptidase/L-asparaginase [Myxococcaceae bacterium]